METLLDGVVMTVVGSVASGLVALVQSFRLVHEGELGLKLRFGKVVRKKDEPKIIKPGLMVMIPFVESLRRRHVRQQTLNFQDQSVTLSNGLTFKVSAAVIFRVEDIYKALFETDDLDDSLDDFCSMILRETLSEKTHCRGSERPSDCRGAAEEAQEQGDLWGVKFIRFGLTDCAPAHETAHIFSAEVGVKIKLQALLDAQKDLGLKEIDPILAAALSGIPGLALWRGIKGFVQHQRSGIYGKFGGRI